MSAMDVFEEVTGAAFFTEVTPGWSNIRLRARIESPVVVTHQAANSVMWYVGRTRPNGSGLALRGKQIRSQ